MMKLKDYVTLGNLLCGVASTVALLEDDFSLACFLILLGYVFDILDGLVARLTKQINRFGSELDNLCDLITYSVAPSFLLFYAFYNIAGFPLVVAASLGFITVAVGVVRHARNAVMDISVPGFFIGMPRPAFALCMIALLRSSLFQFLGGTVAFHFYYIPMAMVLLFSFMMLTTRPCISHHGIKWKGLIRFGMWFFVASIPVGTLAGWLLLGDPELVFDVLLFDLLVYVLLSHWAVPPEIMRRAQEALASAKSE